MLMTTLNRREALQYFGAFATPFLATGLAQEPQNRRRCCRCTRAGSNISA